jgi:mannose/fructose/N-acetylgalactosamine-specific phosphotransferase system component IIC
MLVLITLICWAITGLVCVGGFIVFLGWAISLVTMGAAKEENYYKKTK